jgi:molybdate transport system substrate-binding protein
MTKSKYLRVAAALWVAGSLGAAVARGEEVTVFAAVSLTETLQELGRAYEVASGNHVVFSFGASSDLARQIQAGAPADLFFSADAGQMDALERAGILRSADRVDVLSNVLVAIVPADSKAKVALVSDILNLDRIALADPEAVPAGVYARAYLESASLWEKVRNKVIPTLNVRAALAAVESGNVDLGFVYRTDAVTSKRVRVAFEVPRGTGPRIVYPLASIASSKKTVTQSFKGFLLSPQASLVYEKHGFLVLARSAP